MNKEDESMAMKKGESIVMRICEPNAMKKELSIAMKNDYYKSILVNLVHIIVYINVGVSH